MSQQRKRPTVSATLYPVGTVQQGNDGAMWAVAETKGGVQRWRRVSQKDGARAAGGCACPSVIDGLSGDSAVDGGAAKHRTRKPASAKKKASAAVRKKAAGAAGSPAKKRAGAPAKKAVGAVRKKR